MYKYLDILNVSIFLTSLYIVSSNLFGDKYKKSIGQFITLITIVFLKLIVILSSSNGQEFSLVKIISGLIILILLVEIELSEMNKKSKIIILCMNYILAVGSLVLILDSKRILYMTVIATYILIANLYLFSTFLSNSKLKLKHIFHFMYFGQLFVNLILTDNTFLMNINYVLDFIFSIYILLKLFKMYIKDFHDKSVDISSKINRSNINMKIHNEKLNMKKNVNNELNEMISNKKVLLDLMLKDLKKCMFLIDNEGYIVNEDNGFYETWKEYSNYEYNISVDVFCENSIEDGKTFLANLEMARSTHKEMKHEIKDKRGRYLSCSHISVNLSNSQRGVICIMTDITSRKNIEIKIKDNDTKYKKIVDNMPYSMLIASKDEILYDNQKNKYIDFNKDDIKNIILGEYPKGELYYTYTNGVDVCLNIDKIDYNEGGNYKSLFAIRDITNFKNLLEDLEHSKKRYESLVNIIPEGIYVLNFENKILKYANTAFLNMVGTEDISSIDIESINKNIIITSGNTNNTVKYKRDILINKYGEKVNIECGGMLLNINKKIKLIGIVRDITEQIRTESIEREIEEKEKLNKSKTEFFINMSHELKTPLNLIHSSNQLVEVLYKAELEKNNNTEVLDAVNVIKKHTNILMGLIDNIIELAKLQSDFHEIKKDYYNVVDISEDIVTEFSKCVNRDELNIIFDTDKEEKIANIDADDIEKVILIFLSIVVRYSIKNSDIYFDLGSRKDFITMTIKNIGGYDNDKYINDSERKVLDMGIVLAKLIIELYEGKITINTSSNNIEIIAEIKVDYEIKIYKERVKTKQGDFVYSEYKKMCSF